MAKPILHAPLKDSPTTFLLEAINDIETVLQLVDVSKFEAAGITRLTLGIDGLETETVEVVSYNVLTNEVTVIRGPEPLSWPNNTNISRVFTAADLDEVHDYLEELNDDIIAKGVTNGDNHDHSGGDGAQIDHGALGGLADDDHSQYLNNTRHDTATRHTLGTVVPHDDHGSLSGLGDDDHPQYLKTSGKAADSDKLDGIHASGFAAALHNHDHGALSGLGDNDHPQYRQTSVDIATEDLGDGIVTWAKRAAKEHVRATRFTNMTTTSTLTAVTFTAESFDNDTMWTSGSPTKITFTTAGYYLVTANAQWNPGTQGNYRIATVFRNGSTDDANWICGNGAAASDSGNFVASASGYFYFSAGDYIELKVQTEESATLTRASLAAVRLM